MTFKVAIIGRPNVGKSTLFNRLVGKKLALVDDTPGVTRDRREGDARLGDLSFKILDTAGLEEAKGDKLEARMREQTDKAISEAHVCMMLIDARAGVTPLDAHFADILRRQDKPVLLLANKCEGAIAETNLYEAYSLGLGDPIAISAEHGEGMGDLYAALEPLAAEFSPEGDPAMRAEAQEDFDPDAEYVIDTSRPLRICIVGRPNAGKSTLVNSLLGEDRMLTGPEAGITRDSIAVDYEWQGRPIKMFDTAGLRKKARIHEKLEKMSVSDALRAVQFAEVVVLLIDAQAPLEKQDLQIADLVIREGRGLVIGINKWDLVEDRQAYTADLREKVERLLPQVRGVPLVFFSGLTGRGMDRLMPAVFKVQELWNKRVPTAALNRWLDEALTRHPPPSVGGRRLAIRYITQIKSRPPTFALFAPRAEELPDSYARYLVNSFREAFDVPAVPIRMLLRKGKNPYAGKAKRRH